MNDSLEFFAGIGDKNCGSAMSDCKSRKFRRGTIYRYFGEFYCCDCIPVVSQSRLACATTSLEKMQAGRIAIVDKMQFNRPLYCELCQKFLRNRLNRQGFLYVCDAVGRNWPGIARVREWDRYYLRGYEPTRYYNSKGIAIWAR